MQVYGNIGTPLEPRQGQNGTRFYTFRLAENQGQPPNRYQTWYEVVAFLDEVQADLLAKGQFVCVTGRLEHEAFMKRDGTPGSAVKIITGSIKPVEKGRKNNSSGE